MLRIPCPFCGERDEIEFCYGGEPQKMRPGLAGGDVEWSNYLFSRANPKGLIHELWCHNHGCNQWFVVQRDTVTHRIHKVSRNGASLNKSGHEALACE